MFHHKMEGVRGHTRAQRGAGMTRRRVSASLSVWPLYSEVILGAELDTALALPLGQLRLSRGSCFELQLLARTNSTP